MSSAQTLTYEQMMNWQQETKERIENLLLAQQETREQMKETDRKIASLGNRIGQLVQAMVQGGIVRLFQNPGYSFNVSSREVEFKNKDLDIYGEIDLFLENGDYALLVEVKTEGMVTVSAKQ